MLLAAVAAAAQDDAAEAEYEKFADVAWKSFRESSGKVDKQYGIGKYERWDFDQDTGQIVFSDKGVKKLIADAQIIGSWASNLTWLWAWDNRSIDAALKKDALKVREFGKQKKFWRLTTAEFMSELHEGWTLIAIAGHITKAKTAFRGPRFYLNGNSIIQPNGLSKRIWSQRAKRSHNATPFF